MSNPSKSRVNIIREMPKKYRGRGYKNTHRTFNGRLWHASHLWFTLHEFKWFLMKIMLFCYSFYFILHFGLTFSKSEPNKHFYLSRAVIENELLEFDEAEDGTEDNLWENASPNIFIINIGHFWLFLTILIIFYFFGLNSFWLLDLGLPLKKNFLSLMRLRTVLKIIFGKMLHRVRSTKEFDII